MYRQAPRPPPGTSARAARHAEDVLERKFCWFTLFEQREHREAAVAVEDIDVAARIVLLNRDSVRVSAS